MIKTAFVYVAAAFFEIAGCFSFWIWIREGKTGWWLAPGIVSLMLFAGLLIRWTPLRLDAPMRPMAASISAPRSCGCGPLKVFDRIAGMCSGR